MKIADMDWYFDLKKYVIKENLKIRLTGLNIGDGPAIYYKYFFDQKLRYSSYDSDEMETASKVYYYLRDKNVTIYDSETGKNKRVRLENLPLYLAKNRVVNLKMEDNGYLVYHAFVFNGPRKLYHGNLMIYVTEKGTMYWHTKDSDGGTCYKQLPYWLNSDYAYWNERTGEYIIYGLKFWQQQVKFYYRKPSRYYYIGTNFLDSGFGLVRVSDMSREDFIRNIEIGKFDLFGD